MDRQAAAQRGTLYEGHLASLVTSQIPGSKAIMSLYFDCRYLKKGYTQIDVTLVTDHAIYCIEAKNFIGYMSGSYADYEWNGRGASVTNLKFFNPIYQNLNHVRLIKAFLKKRTGENLPVYNVVVVPNECMIDSSCKEIIHENELLAFIRRCDSMNVPLDKDRIFNILNREVKHE